MKTTQLELKLKNEASAKWQAVGLRGSEEWETPFGVIEATNERDAIKKLKKKLFPSAYTSTAMGEAWRQNDFKIRRLE